MWHGDRFRRWRWSVSASGYTRRSSRCGKGLFRSLRSDRRRVLAQFRRVRGIIPPENFDAALVAHKDGTEVFHVTIGPLELEQSAIGIAHRQFAARSAVLRPDLDRASVIRTKSALDLVEAVRAPAGDPPTLAAAIELDELAPAIDQFQIKGAQLGLVAPLVPIEAGGEFVRRIARLPEAARGEVARDHGGDFADGALPHELAGVPVDGHRALLGAGLHDPFVFVGGFDQHASFGKREALRFLHIGVAAGLHRVDTDQHAGVHRRFHEHRVEFFLFQHITVVLIYDQVFCQSLLCGGVGGQSKRARINCWIWHQAA